MKRHEIKGATYCAKMCKTRPRSQRLNETNQLLWLKLIAEQEGNGALKGKMKQFNNSLFQSEKLIEGKQHPDIEAIVGNKNATRNEICYSKTCSIRV